MHSLKLLVGLAVLAASSVVQAAPRASEAVYDACWAKGELHMSLARSAGYESPEDLAGIWVETMGACLTDAGESQNVAQADASALYCTIVADLKANSVDPDGRFALETCDSELAERLAERAP